MVLPGHLAGGYIASLAVLSALSPGTHGGGATAWLILGTLAGELPDLDIALHYLSRHRRDRNMKNNHREYVTHVPLFWIVLGILGVLVGETLESPSVMLGSVIVAAGALSHLILDSFEFGVAWLRPFSKKRFALFKTKEDDHRGEDSTFRTPWSFVSSNLIFIRNSYIRRISFYLELAITILALYLLLAR